MKNYSDCIGNIIKYRGEDWIVRRAAPVGIVIQQNKLCGALWRIPVNEYEKAVFYGGFVETDKTPSYIIVEMDRFEFNYTEEQATRYKWDLRAMDIQDLLAQHQRRSGTYRETLPLSEERAKVLELLNMIEKEIINRSEY